MSAKELLAMHEQLCSEARSIMEAKNHDYTSGSGDPYHNFRGSKTLGVDPIVGVMLRMQDKMQRIKTFAEKGELLVKGEGVEDAFRDLINYTVLAYGLSREERAAPSNEPAGTKTYYDSKIVPNWPHPLTASDYEAPSFTLRD